MLNLGFPHAELFHDHADELLGNVHREPLHRLHQLAVHVLGHDLGLAGHQLIALAAHGFDHDGKLQFAATHDFEGIGAAGFLDADGNVGEQLLLQALAQVARGDVLPVEAGERRGVHRELHGDGGLINRDVRQRGGIFGAGDGLADGDAGDSRDRNDVAQFGFRNVDALQPVEGKQLGDPHFLQGAVELGNADILAGAQRAVEDARDGQPPEVIAVIEIRHQDLQRAIGVAGGRRDGLHDGIEQRLQILTGGVRVRRRRAQPGIGIQNRKIEQFLGRVEIDEQVVNFVQHFLGTRVGAVNLVDHHDRRQLGFQRLAQHIARLRQRALAGVHQEHDAVHHLERAFHLAAEIAVAGRVHDVDLDVVVKNGRVLGQDGDAALALQFVGIHDAVHQLLVGAKYAALAEHGVHQRGLAVVDVGDDGDVANTQDDFLRCRPNVQTG